MAPVRTPQIHGGWETKPGIQNNYEREERNDYEAKGIH